MDFDEETLDEENLGEETLRKLRERGVFQQMGDKGRIEFLEAVIEHIYNAGGTPEISTCEMCATAYGWVHYKRIPIDWNSIKAEVEKHPTKLHIGSHWQ